MLRYQESKCWPLIKEDENELVLLAAVYVLSGSSRDGSLLFVYGGLRENIREKVRLMIYLTVFVVVFVFIYLVVTLVRPEWF